MDPLSQASFGASLSQSLANRRQQAMALFIGAMAGMAPDLDVLISSKQDPLLFLEYHRHFTHSLIFIPIGALIVAAALYLLVSLPAIANRINHRLSFKQFYLFSFLGYATHGLLDACTSYGTQLFWPFSNERVAWNTVSIIDPLFTFPVLILICLAVYKNKVSYARAGFVYAVLFLAAGQLQYQRAEAVLHQLAESRGHQVERVHIKPSFGNRHLWKMMYEANGYYHVDAVRLLNEPEVIEGDYIRKLNIEKDFPWLPVNSQQAKDIERFRWFSDDFLAVLPGEDNIIFDVRYSFIPDEIELMWGIELDPYAIEQGMMDLHIEYVRGDGLSKEKRERFFQMVFD